MTEFFEAYRNKLAGSLYGLLCERENRGKWEEFLDTIIVEFVGLEEELSSINYWKIRAKLGSLRYLSFFHFRKTIFECISLTNTLEIEEL